MYKVSSKKIAEVLRSGSSVIDFTISNISTDSRNIKKGDLFIAIKGEVYDGHDFVKDVIEKGASAVIVDRLISDVPAVRQIVVPNTKVSFAELGRLNRERYKGKIISLTGSAGKTTTKEEIKFLLSRFSRTYATTGNLNNDIGVPKTLCDLNIDSDFAIIEVGMSSKGEISYLMPYVKPDIALVTNIYPMHIEFFESIEKIAEAKAEIFEGLSKDGVAVINEDTQCFDILYKKAKENTDNIVTYGKKNIASMKEEGKSTYVVAKIGTKEVAFSIPMLGLHTVYNAIAALTIADICGADVEKAAEYLKLFDAVDGRGKQHELKLNDVDKYTLIDDSYSGQPESMKIAIENLGKVKTDGRKVAVLGKMAELGTLSKEKHIEIGKALAKTDIDIVVTICPETKDILDQLNYKFEKHYFDNIDGLDNFLLNNLLQNKDIVLIKGARYSSKLYKIAEVLINKGAN